MTIRSPPDKPASMSSTALEEMDLFPGSRRATRLSGTVMHMRTLGSLGILAMDWCGGRPVYVGMSTLDDTVPCDICILLHTFSICIQSMHMSHQIRHKNGGRNRHGGLPQGGGLRAWEPGGRMGAISPACHPRLPVRPWDPACRPRPAGHPAACAHGIHLARCS